MARLLMRAAFVCLLAAATPATTLPKKTTKDLVSMARRVCCARCLDVEARLDPITGLVFTHVRLRRIDDLKGGGEDSLIELRIVGGRVGNRVTEVAGMPRFARDRECILFLGDKNRLGYPVVIQARRGVLDLRTDREARRFLARPVDGMPGLKANARVLLDDFAESVRAVVREDRARAEAK
jgi:hypothetical protein